MQKAPYFLYQQEYIVIKLIFNFRRQALVPLEKNFNERNKVVHLHVKKKIIMKIKVNNNLDIVYK